MKKRPKILITNDDGVHAPGVKHLFRGLADYADLTVVAPSVEQSAVGLSITIRAPLHIKKVDWVESDHVWSVSGTPADCVKLALHAILQEKPDLIVSGINRGSNAGRNIFYSGTVAGVIEGLMHEIPGIAFSCAEFYETDYRVAEKYVASIVRHVLDHPLPQGTFLNVNFPHVDHNALKGFKLTKHGKEFWGEDPHKREHPAEKQAYYWLGAKIMKYQEEEDCDVRWLQEGYITGVPVHVGQLTDHRHVNDKKALFEGVFQRQEAFTIKK